MRLLLVADGRSPIALNWIQALVRRGHVVHLVSTYPCRPSLDLASLEFIPTAFSNLKGSAASQAPADRRGLWSAPLVNARTALRRWLAPFSLGAAAHRLRNSLQRIRPDLVHAMRIPYEGMLASRALQENHPVPLLVSIWGNDLTLHAPATPAMRRETVRVLQRADALHADCRRDIHLAHAWGYPTRRPSMVLPGAGGIQSEVFYPPARQEMKSQCIIQPRGVRAYVCGQAFFHAIPLVLQHFPSARFLCPAMADDPQVPRWVAETGAASQVDLLPLQSREQMAELFRQAAIVVSPSTHDGTPNTLLEALACGCFPIAGDLEALREWITPGMNGLLVDPRQPQALADAMCLALQHPNLRQQAAAFNQVLIATRADHRRVMDTAEQFYQEITK